MVKSYKKGMDHMTNTVRARIARFHLGIYVFKDAEIIDYAAPYGAFSVSRTMEYTKGDKIYRDDLEVAGASTA